jgi:hypothetical protein
MTAVPPQKKQGSLYPVSSGGMELNPPVRISP